MDSPAYPSPNVNNFGEYFLSYFKPSHCKGVQPPCRARAELRRMLGREIGVPPHLVPIENDGHGKPRCPHPRAAGMDFSISHADDCAIIALGEAAGLGVDVEMVVEDEPSDELLDIVF